MIVSRSVLVGGVVRVPVGMGTATVIMTVCDDESGCGGGVGLCQVAVHVTYAGWGGHALIDRAVYPTHH